MLPSSCSTFTIIYLSSPAITDNHSVSPKNHTPIVFLLRNAENLCLLRHPIAMVRRARIWVVNLRWPLRTWQVGCHHWNVVELVELVWKKLDLYFYIDIWSTFWSTNITMDKSPFLMGISTISMAIFNSFLYVYQRVYNVVPRNVPGMEGTKEELLGAKGKMFGLGAENLWLLWQNFTRYLKPQNIVNLVT